MDTGRFYRGAAMVLLAFPFCAEARANEEPGVGVEEIVVTAERRTSTAQNTGLAITALSGQTLEEQGVQTLDNLANAVPNLVFAQENSEFKVVMRGVGADNISINGSQGVALHLDGVPLSRPSGFNAAIYDVARVEVLRGPQGTLYGRNATGGAINVISNAPSYDFDGGFDFQYGAYDNVRVRGYANVPIVADKLAARFTVSSESRDGVQKNLFPGGTEGGDIASTYLRGQILFEPVSNFSLTLRGSLLDISGVGPSRKRMASPVDAGPPDNGFVPEFPDLYTVWKDTPESQDVTLKFLSAEANWTLPFATLTVLGGYVSNSFSVVGDADQTTGTRFSPPGPYAQDSIVISESDSKQYSLEGRLASNGTGPLEWLIGGFYLKEKVDYELHVDTYRPGPPQPPFNGFVTSFVDQINDADTRSSAAFGQASYRFGGRDQFKLTAGLRYTDEKRSGNGDVRTVVTRPGPGGITDNHIVNSPSGTWDAVTWRLAFDWNVTPANLFYASVSTGFKSGGFNFGVQDVNQTYYDPEDLTAYEVGLKNRFFDNRLQFNLSAFYYDYKDLQAFQIINDISFVQNAAVVSNYGVEAELVARPTDRLSLDGHIAWQHARYDRFASRDVLYPEGRDLVPNSGDELVDLSGNRMQNAPDFSARLGVEYALPLADKGNLTFRVQSYYQTKVFLRAFNLEPYDKQGAYTRTDASVRFKTADDRWTLFAGVDNIEDKAVISSIDVTATGRFLANIRDPRTWYVGFGFAF